MSNSLNDIVQINSTDTISQFMEKCNNNFYKIVEFGGGPAGVKGESGSQGVPTKPKVPIHVWKKETDYDYEIEITDEVYIINSWYNDLSDDKYQEGHLIILENGHVYKLEQNDNFELEPIYIISIQSYDPGTVIDGKQSYVHFAYANSIDGEDFIIPNIPVQNNEEEYGESDSDIDSIKITDRKYIGVYSDFNKEPSEHAISYTWTKLLNDNIHLELTKDYIVLPSNIDGSSVHPDYTDGITFEMILYNGDEKINSNIEYKFKINNTEIADKYITIKDGKFTISIDTITSDTDIECIAIYNKTEFHKILSIHIKETPYEIELDKNILSRNPLTNEIFDGKVGARVKYLINGEWKYITDGLIIAEYGSSSGYDDEKSCEFTYDANPPSNNDYRYAEISEAYYSDIIIKYCEKIIDDEGNETYSEILSTHIHVVDNGIGMTPTFKIDEGDLKVSYNDPGNSEQDDWEWITLGTVLGNDGASITITGTEEKDGSGETNTVTFSDGNELKIKNGSKGDTGTSVTITNIEEKDGSGKTNTVTFSDGNILQIKNGKDGENGTSVTITGTEEKDGSGETNTVTFSDGNILQIKNGSKGDTGTSVTITGTKKIDGKTTITFSDDNKIQIEDGKNGTNGTNGITPKLKIEENNLKVSYDEGKNWETLVPEGVQNSITVESGSDESKTLFKVSEGEITMAVGNFGIMISNDGIFRKEGDTWVGWN